MSTKSRATIDDLYHVPENAKAEIVDGELVVMSPTGDLPNRAAGTIYVSLRQYERKVENGRAYTDNAGFRVDLPGRESFSPDASFYIGPRAGGKFLEGAPVFAAEVRSEGDYGPQAERELAQKRVDYFAAGTSVVWDVDVLQDEVVRVYHADDPENVKVYGRGQIAEAEAALPGWRVPVDELFD
jgi:Uma2 family endonuclease